MSKYKCCLKTDLDELDIEWTTIKSTDEKSAAVLYADYCCDHRSIGMLNEKVVVEDKYGVRKTFIIRLTFIPEFCAKSLDQKA